MLRNLNQSSGGRRILGVPQVGIEAATIASQTATGDNGPGLLYDESINPVNSGKQLRLVVNSPPSAGVFYAYENGSFDFSGAPDGSYSIGYNVLADKVLIGSDTATVAVGAVSATAPGVTLTGTSSVSTGAATGGASGDATAPGATLTGTGGLAPGTATGGSAGDATAPGATLTGTSDLTPGAASGEQNAPPDVIGHQLLSSAVSLTTTYIDIQPAARAYLPGQAIRLGLRVADIDGRAADPGAVVLKIRPPTGPVVSYSLAATPEIVRDAAGRYHADLQLLVAGLWAYRWQLTTPNAGAAEGVINVSKSRVI